jgi:hypothetical protein
MNQFEVEVVKELVTLLLIILKINGILMLSWWLILAPMYGVYIISIIGLILGKKG